MRDNSDLSLRPVARSRLARARRAATQERMADTQLIRNLHGAMGHKLKAETAVTSAEHELAEVELILEGRRRNLAHKRTSIDTTARDLLASINAVDIAEGVVADRRHALAARRADAAAAAQALVDAERAHAASVEPVEQETAPKTSGRQKKAAA